MSGDEPRSASDAIGVTESSAEPSADFCVVVALPTSSGRYVIGAEIARGGMGEVCRATDTVLGREVAVKVLLDKYDPASRTARRFADEARITGQLQHPAIPPIHDLGILPDGRPFLAMKLVRGNTLDELLKARSDPAHDLGRFVAAFEQVCQAVAYAHAHGVIHRDLKPANVMVGSFGEVQVMDWGLAKVLRGGSVGDEAATDPESTSAETEIKSVRDSDDLLTQAGSVLGTPAFMAPEQALGAVHEIDARSDVFGLGGILATILTGRPPFVGNTAETTRVMAARGELEACFSRLGGCGADPELVALCKRCLATSRTDRPASAGVVAAAVAALREAAEERVRQAEIDKVTAAAERAAADARRAERRRRRRTWVGVAVALTLTVVAGLAAVLVVQDRAKRDLEAKNSSLEAERAKVEQRFQMARKAIAAFHTTIDEQPELGNEAFRPLRKKLLGAAAGFYRELEVLLADEPDRKSRAALAEGYCQLAELTAKVGDRMEALAAYRKALVLRRGLAAAPGADAEPRLAMSATLRQVGQALAATGDTAGAMRAYEEARDVAAALQAEAPTDAVLQALASGHHAIGAALSRTGRTAEALAAFERARDLRKKLSDGNPAVTAYRSELAQTLSQIAIELQDRMDKPAEAMATFREVLAIRQQLADAHPADIAFQSKLATIHYNLGVMLRAMGQPEKALAAYRKALDIYQKLADAHPAVTEFQGDLAAGHQSIGWVLGRSGKAKEALVEDRKARDILQKLADAHPAVTAFQSDLAQSHHNVGLLFRETGQPAEALAAYRKALDIRQRLADAQPTVSQFQRELAVSHFAIAGMLARSGQPGEALAEYQKSRERYQRLADAEPNTLGYRDDLAGAHNELGRLLAKEGRYAEAFTALDTGLAIREKLVAADAKSLKYALHLGFSCQYRGWARARAGQPKEAAADLRKALALWAKDPDDDAEDLFEEARALAILAKLGADAKSGVSFAEAKAFADLAVAALAKAVNAGWAEHPAELAEPDFDAIRGRAEFKRLVDVLHAKAAELQKPATPPNPAGR